MVVVVVLGVNIVILVVILKSTGQLVGISEGSSGKYSVGKIKKAIHSFLTRFV